MSRRSALFVLLLLASALAITAVLVVGDRSARGQDARKDGNSIAHINAKAALLNTGDEGQIREIADQVFQSFDLDQVPAGLADSIKDRLVRAEVNYRTGRGKPVSEFGVVRMVNMLADKFGGPAYAKTNVFEVRRLEMNFIPVLSKFIGRKPAGVASGPKPLHSSFNPTMSPLEAVTVAGLLIQQKRFNPTYQVTEQEWAAQHYGKGKAKINVAEAVNAPRSDEFDRAIERATDAMTVGDLLKLSHQALDQLGVARSEGRQ